MLCAERVGEAGEERRCKCRDLEFGSRPRLSERLARTLESAESGFARPPLRRHRQGASANRVPPLRLPRCSHHGPLQLCSPRLHSSSPQQQTYSKGHNGKCRPSNHAPGCAPVHEEFLVGGPSQELAGSARSRRLGAEIRRPSLYLRVEERLGSDQCRVGHQGGPEEVCRGGGRPAAAAGHDCC